MQDALADERDERRARALARPVRSARERLYVHLFVRTNRADTLDAVQGFLSLLSCASFVVSSYQTQGDIDNKPSGWLKVVEHALTGALSADYLPV